VTHVAAEEHLAGGLAQLERPDPLAHPVLGDHLARQARGLLDVVRGAGGRVVEDEFLGHAPAHGIGELVEQFVARGGVLVLGGHHHRVAEGPAAREDRHLGHGVRVPQRRRHERVPALVVRGDLLLLLVHHPRALLRTRDDAVDRLVQGAVVDQLRTGARGEQRRLVEAVGKVRTGEARGTAGEDVQVHPGCHRLALRVDLEDREAAVEVGRLHRHLAIEPPGPQQRGVEDVRPVGGRDEDDVGVGVEPVHLHEQLVEGLLALVVAAAQAGATMPTDGVDLVHEDDARRVLLGLLEQVAHARGADPDEHLDEVGTRDAEEGHARLAGDRPGEQGLAGARRAVEQDPLGDARPELLELLRVLEELLDLLELLDGLVHAGHVLERDSGRVGAHPAGAALAEAHDLGATTLHLVHDEDPEADHQDERQDERQGARPPRVARTCGRELDAGILDELRRLVGARILDLVGDGVAVGILLGGRHL